MIHNTVVLRSLLLGAVLLAGAPIAAHDLARPARAAAVSWSPDFTAALATAREANRIVVVCFNMDGEAANESALSMYGTDAFVDAVRDAVCVMCSADEHAPGSQPCPRFGGLQCTQHRDCEKKARAHLFGARRENIAPQHLILYPDGVVAWHGVYEQEPRTILRAIRDADISKDAPLAQRVRRQRLALEQLKRRAKNVPAAYTQVLASLALTPAASFLDALAVLGTDVGAMVLDDLATFRRDVAEPLLTVAGKHTNRALRERAHRLLASVRARPAAANGDEQAGEAERSDPSGEDAVERPVTIDSPLPGIADTDSLGRVHWAGTEPTLEECRGRVTVLWFFRDDAVDLTKEVARMNEFARGTADKGIQVLGFAVALRPSEAVGRLQGLGCAFPVGAYQATNSNRFFGIERFPAWGVLDPEAQLVFRSPQASATVSWTAALDLARAMAASPAYAGALRPSPSR